MLAIVVIALFMSFYFKIHLKKAIIVSLLFQALLLSVDYFTLWLNVSLFHSVAEINESHFVGGSLITVLAKIILFLVVDCQHFFRQIFLGYFPDIVQAFDTLGRNVYGDDYTSLHNPIVLSSVLLVYGMFHSTRILF